MNYESLFKITLTVLVILIIGAVWFISRVIGTANDIKDRESVNGYQTYDKVKPGVYEVLSIREAYEGDMCKLTVLFQGTNGDRVPIWTTHPGYGHEPSKAYQMFDKLTSGDRVSIKLSDDDKGIMIGLYYG